MLNRLIEHRNKIGISILIIFGFGLIRAFENSLFYDPFLVYFEAEFKNTPYPQVDVLKLLGGLLVRYSLNSILSLALIYNLFRDVEILKFSTFLYLFFLVFLMVAFVLILEYFPDGNWLLFYVRRFIIQPIFVILFIPAFYYQQENFKK
ncbi:exosortase F system-associated membrane protein [Flavobacterium branchiicola]|uniref:Exosortase F system-associated protein n=1 Tax=Flavobacterium branchiicola TaxID=1114875 RepID=A0ABV9P788_9FLAO|nr:exosortase F system-associated protein [Flavobacterium branchiicola]MBS7252890.1 exosortase F system-associated protein [Flavobacterium branchiicola]